jgi:hypothetical protein
VVGNGEQRRSDTPAAAQDENLLSCVFSGRNLLELDRARDSFSVSFIIAGIGYISIAKSHGLQRRYRQGFLSAYTLYLGSGNCFL